MKYGEAFNTYLSNSSMRVRRQANEFINLHKQLGQVDKQTKKAKLSQAEYDSQTQKTINDLGQVSFKAKAAAIGVKALGVAIQTAFNVGISLVINGIITGISEFVNKQKELEELSQEAADNIKTELTSLEEYSVKISKLRTELDEANTTTERATEIRNELYEIQNNLIENYGIEKDSINLVTGSLKEQIAQIRELGKAEYESNFYSNTRATLDVIDKLNNTQLDLDRRVSKGFYENGNFIDFSKEVEEVMSKILNDSELINSTWDSSHWTLDTNAFDAHDALLNLQKQVEDTISSLDVRDYRNVGEFSYIRKQYQEVLNYLSDVNREFTKPLTEHEEELAQYIKYASKYTEEYWDLVRLRSEYEIAQEKGTEEEILKARQAFLERYNGLVIANDDSATRWYFDKEFGDVANESEKTADTTVKNLNPIKDKLNELNSAVSELKETTDSAFSNQSTLQSAFDKIQEGASLSADEVRKLVEIYPELAIEFTKTVDGYTISSDALIKANDNIIQSTKESVEAQIKGYQDVIDKYNEIKNIVSMPESARQDRLKALGLTEDDIKNAEQQINQYRLILSMLGITLEKTTEEVSKYNQIIKDNSSKVSLIASATKEMTDEGHISASTYAELVEKGGNFTECLEVQNGKLVLNIDKLKELEKQEYLNIIAENNLAIKKLETTERTSSNAKAVWEEIQAYKTENALLQQMANEIDDAGVEEPPKDTSDPIKEAFEKEMKDIEHLHNMGLASDKEYYDALEKANERHYKNSVDHESDYLSNIEKIYKARQSLYKDDADKQFDDLEDQRKRGIITAEQYAQGLHDLGQELYGEDSIYGGTEFAIKALEELDKKVKETSDDIYNEFKEGLSVDGDRLLDDVLADADKLSEKNIKLFSDDPETLRKNAEDIFKSVSESAKDALDKMLITPDEYLQIIDKWGDKLNIAKGLLEEAKELSESDYLDAWDNKNGYDSSNSAKDYKLRAERVKYIYDLAEQLYGKNGQDNVKAYNELIKQGLEEEKSIWEDRINDEKTFWEQQKQNIEDSYDTEIDKLKDVQDEEKKLKDIEEKRLAVIKARQKLEDAKKQKNQLIFEGGTFKYDVNQDDILSAEEELANAIEALRDEELNTQIEILEEQKNAAVDFYEQIIKKIDEYLDKDNKILNSDTEVLDTVFATETDTDTSKSNFDVKKFIENGFTPESFINAFKGAVFSKEAIANMFESFKATRAGTVPANETTSTATNNSNTTNNATKVVNVGGIKVELTLAVQSLEDFVNNKIGDAMDLLGKAIEQKMPEIWAKA